MRRKSGLQLPRNMISWDAGDQHVYVVQGAADRGDCGADSRDCFTHLLSTNCVNSKAQKLPPPFPLLSNTFLLESIIREKYRLRRICTSLGVESSRIVTLWMLYRRPGFLAFVLFGSSPPTPSLPSASCLTFSVFLRANGGLYRRERGVGGGGGAK